MNYLNNIIKVDFPSNQYFKQEFYKSQICLHHTVSGFGVENDIAWWKSTPDRIATSMIIGRDAKIYECFDSKYWGYHLGVRNEDIIAAKIKKYNRLDYTCIGIELDSWGGLCIHTDKNYYPAKWDAKKKKMVPNTACKPVENVTKYNKSYRGFTEYESYTEVQIDALHDVLLMLGNKWRIPLTYNESMWNLSANALTGVSGIWSHGSFRLDKSDVHPQVALIDMLKSF